MTNEHIKVTGLVKRFGKVTALNGINLTVSKGEVLGLLGPNGSGKSTTIRILLGILRATSGRAELFGTDAWSGAVETHRRLAYVPGDVYLWDGFTGGEVIDLLLSLRGEKPDPKKRKSLLDRFELDPTKKCRTYSKGNRQKVALVAALSSDAELFILDEPTSGLDPLMEKVFQECIAEIKREGRSVLLSSHIMSEVEKLADKICIIREGKVVESGTIAELTSKAGEKTLEEIFLSNYSQ